jgi:hypothetical protein
MVFSEVGNCSSNHMFLCTFQPQQWSLYLHQQVLFQYTLEASQKLIPHIIHVTTNILDALIGSKEPESKLREPLVSMPLVLGPPVE